MKKKNKAHRASDIKNLIEIAEETHAEAFEVVQEFREYYTMTDCDIASIPTGIVSRMMGITGFAIRRAEDRCAQEYVADEWSENCTPLSVYEKGGEA